MQVISVSGEKEHGKDTIADYIVSTFSFKKVAFALYLKELVHYMFPEYKDYDKDFVFEIKISYTNILYFLNKFYSDNTHKQSFELTLQIIEKFQSKKYFVSLRDMYQFVGTDIIRNLIDNSFHINKLLNSICDNSKVVISDCRFPNEREMLRKSFRRGKELTMIKVVRRNFSSPRPSTGSTHISESSFGDDEEYDFIIYNDEGLKELYDKIDSLKIFN